MKTLIAATIAGLLAWYGGTVTGLVLAAHCKGAC